MNTDSYLDPLAIKQQCTDMLKEFRTQNTNITNVRKGLRAFINDDGLKTDSFDALKSQINDYMLLLSGMRQANNSDIEDCNSLMVEVGYEILDGAYLISHRDSSKSLYDGYCDQASSYSSKASSCDDSDLADYYSGMASHYRTLASQEYQIYQYYVGKIKKYDDIEAATCTLFTNSKGLRDAVDTGLADVSNNFSEGAYENSSNTKKWKDELKNSGARVKVYPPEEFEFLNTMSDGLGKGSRLYDLKGPVYLAFHGIKLTQKNGKYYFSVGGKTKKAAQEILKEITGNEWKGAALKHAWEDGGILLSSKRAVKHLKGSTMENITNMEKFGNYLKKIQNGSTRFEIMHEEFVASIKNDLNPKNAFDDFKKAKKLGKVAKGAGILGDAFTVVSEFEDNFYEDGDVVVTPDRVQNFVTDTAIDFGTGAATAAAGAAVGSLILPPLGTIVGAGVGMALDTAINHEFKDCDGDGKKDSAVDWLKQKVDSGCNALGRLIFG